jgi:hypothetical protein
LQEEILKQKQRHQLTIRQAEAKESALREAEGEKKRLLTELKWLQQSRDQAICERFLLREDSVKLTSRSKEDVELLVARSQALEMDLKREREEKAELERQLVRTKIRHAEALQAKDTLECLLDYYEDQLKVLNPNFTPQDRDTLGQWLRPSCRKSCDSSEVESQASGTTEHTANPTVSPEEKTKSGRLLMSNFGSKVWQKIKHSGASKKGASEKDKSQDATDLQISTPRSTGSVTPRRLKTQSHATEDSGGSAQAASGDNVAAMRVTDDLSAADSPQTGQSEARSKKRWELRSD